MVVINKIELNTRYIYIYIFIKSGQHCIIIVQTAVSLFNMIKKVAVIRKYKRHVDSCINLIHISSRLIQRGNSLWHIDAIWCKIWVNIGSVYGLWPDGTKQLPEPMLTDHQWSPVTFILGQFRKGCLNRQWLKAVWNLHIQNFIQIQEANDLKQRRWRTFSNRFWAANMRTHHYLNTIRHITYHVIPANGKSKPLTDLHNDAKQPTVLWNEIW